ncbi:hypothetical protein EDM52_20300 [Brevibacillus invocatus]|uniref:Uncharacterized protein n=1 Tax=Brevibacillus invocatus TaxID=173959 RepID=A0A3M8BYG5_9BACL|nr:hypothetical protein [Brevibacillus invocatus]RNB68466.1 hypothetical protein EDM52_20300 [Brevibacillus invocatus]
MHAKKRPITGIFLLSILISILLFFIMGALGVGRGSDGALFAIACVISIQISFLTAFVMSKWK